MVTNVTSLLKTVKAVEDEATKGTRALEATTEHIRQELAVRTSLGHRDYRPNVPCLDTLSSLPNCHMTSQVSFTELHLQPKTPTLISKKIFHHFSQKQGRLFC